ncbi:uncharacterized protein [Watersipora subatra]|uniref:uncharacterized protein n=1 Tax=Watersipora subatra TaxID=2589382 RepID=UPI00355B7822
MKRFEKKLKDLVEIELGVRQHRFRPGRSTVGMIFAIKIVMDKHWEYNRPLFMAFLDQEKAFDSVPRGENLWLETTTGVRQGSILSPLLFIIYLDLIIKGVADTQLLTYILNY